MIRFIHTSDIHFGMENYGRIDPETGIHSRLQDFSRALNACIDTAIEQHVDFFLFSGDAYKTPHPTPTHQRLLMGCLLRLFEAGIPIVLIVGNHDHPLSFGKAHALEIFGQIPLEGFHVISKPQILHLNTKSGPVQIVGIPWPTRAIAALQAGTTQESFELSEHISATLHTIITQYAKKLDPALPAILAGHITVSSGIFSGSEKRALYGNDPILMPSQLAQEPFDYVALGHLHRHQQLGAKGGIPIVYAGSIERIDFGERKEPKGFCLVTIAQKGCCTFEFIETPTRPFIQIDVHLQSDRGHTDQIIHALKAHDLSTAVLKIVYHVPAGVTDRVDTRAIQNIAQDAFYFVGLLPVRIPERREKRTLARVDMSLEELVALYCENKPELSSKTARMIQLAQQLKNILHGE